MIRLHLSPSPRAALWTAGLAVALLHLAPTARAQDAPREDQDPAAGEQGVAPAGDDSEDGASPAPEVDKPRIEIPEGFDPSPFRQDEQASPQDQMIELFHEVERRMSRSTELLFDASKGDTSKLGELGAAGLDELGQDADSSASARAAVAGLLRASKGEGQEVLRAIDEILEIAQNQGGGT
jgi:hypothetical protein